MSYNRDKMHKTLINASHRLVVILACRKTHNHLSLQEGLAEGRKYIAPVIFCKDLHTLVLISLMLAKTH